jgi:GDP-L-fucose synthase
MITKILLTGATGSLERHIRPILDARYGANVTAVSSSDYDVMDLAAVKCMFDDIEPDVVVHLAAYSGGIGANRAYPADFYLRNGRRPRQAV